MSLNIAGTGQAGANQGTAALYGSARMLPRDEMVPAIFGYLDLLYKVKAPKPSN